MKGLAEISMMVKLLYGTEMKLILLDLVDFGRKEKFNIKYSIWAFFVMRLYTLL